MFVGCYLLGGMVIFIGDPVNILSTTLVFLIIVFLTCKGSFWQKLTIGPMFSSTVFSFNALRDNYIHDLLPEVFRKVEHGFPFARLFSLPFAMILYLCSRKFAPDKDYALSDSMWKLLFLLTITPLGIVLDVVTLFRRYDISIDARGSSGVRRFIDHCPPCFHKSSLVCHCFSQTAETGTAEYVHGNQPQIL